MQNGGETQDGWAEAWDGCTGQPGNAQGIGWRQDRFSLVSLTAGQDAGYFVLERRFDLVGLPAACNT